MAKKETTTKKATTKKTTTKRVTSKKANTKPTEPIIEIEKDETPTLNYEELYVKENVPEKDEELQKQIVKHVASEILVEKNNDINEFMSTPQDEMLDKVKEKIENIKKINNQKVNDRIDNLFGYLWNGQEMDY